MGDMEWTGELTIKILQELIENKSRELNNTPAFLEDERNALEMEISTYKRDLKRVKGDDADE